MIKKRILSIIAAVLLVTAFATPVSAQNLDDAEMRRGALCDNCNRGEIVTTYEAWSDWRYLGRQSCIHRAYGEDAIYFRTRQILYRCPFCGNNWTNVSSQTKLECHGWNA